MNPEGKKLDEILTTLEKSRLKKKEKVKRPTVYLDTSNYKTYYSEKEQLFHKSEIEQLFTWNFGKDWSIYLFLEYSLIRGYHNVRYNSHHPLEDLSIAFVMRQAHFAKAKLLLHSYLTTGFERTQSCIRLNQFRIVWRGQYWVSSEITEKLSSKNKTDKVEIESLDKPDKNPLRIIAIEKADGYF